MTERIDPGMRDLSVNGGYGELSRNFRKMFAKVGRLVKGVK